MNRMTYKTQVTIQEPNQLVLTDLPFRPGQRVEVVVIDEAERAERLSALKALLAKTQALPQARAISEEEIAADRFRDQFL
jgi:hypothetical protein